MTCRKHESSDKCLGLNQQCFLTYFISNRYNLYIQCCAEGVKMVGFTIYGCIHSGSKLTQTAQTESINICFQTGTTCFWEVFSCGCLFTIRKVCLEMFQGVYFITHTSAVKMDQSGSNLIMRIYVCIYVRLNEIQYRR